MFCGAAEGLDPRYRDLSSAVGELLARLNLRLVYGGSKDGLMGAVANGTLQGGGQVLGVLPEQLVLREVAHPGITQLISINSMAERKKILFEEADLFLILPGGMGTLDELFEVITANTLGFMSKPVVVLDAFGFYSPLLNWLEFVAAKGFARAPSEMFCIVHDLAGLEAFLG